MRCIVLASGSKGNCAVIEGSAGSILIDAGLSTKEMLRRMAATGVDPDTIDAVLVTHEHGDHVRGLDVTARKLDIPVYATEGTLRDFLEHRRTSQKPLRHHTCSYHEQFSVGNFLIKPFGTSHDAAEPCGFVISDGDTRIGYCTDTGIMTAPMLGLLRPCDGIVLESNHCPEMLANGPYPESLKRRIRSKRGHLSNQAAAECLRGFGKDVPRIILAHLSEVNNTPEKAWVSARDGLGLFFEEESVVVATQCGTCPERPQEFRL
ncbi:MAG: MBL fold metallo-hydrolase [Methanoregula sp.]|jgi:phosphoribosyl 1,2-cyclic phosphodiesterase|uniref:MBL fold metallo-hydrolase n=1 Tax=Methanoregula sp. TaxID=2052170 RepID=UPI0025E8F883|nr:MBL fold metallo-hydrolase [Methanoregula sp.]MCK9630688.1 MBL fold metallo-hydrolase [Methanoregula sp.]